MLRYSAAVNAILGVAILSIAGSFARFINNTASIYSTCLLKFIYEELSFFKVIPIAANTTANLESEFKTFACLAICAASSACGRPDPEKTGNFCPLTKCI